MKLTNLALACAMTSALVACGGGGGSSNDSVAVAQTTRTLDGVAAKGLIKNGVVKVYSYSADGTKSSTPIAIGRTLADGSYTVPIGSTIGLLTVDVSADANTTMADEVSHQDIPMPSGMSMRTVLVLDKDTPTKVAGHITPLTEMLVSATVSAGGMNTANVASAQTGVIKMLGFDPRATKPINADDSTAAAAMDNSQQKQYLYLTALSKIANNPTNSLGCTGTVSDKVACSVKAVAGSVSLKDGVLSLNAAARQEFLTARDAVIDDVTLNKTAIKTPDGQTTFSPVIVPTAAISATPVAAAKAMFASVRTNLHALSNVQDTGELNIRADAMKADFNTAIAPLDQDLADWVQISERGIGVFNNFIANVSTQPSVGIYRNRHMIGFCQVYADTAANTTVAKTPAEAKSVFCGLNKTPVVGSESPVAGATNLFTRKQFTKTIILVPVAGSNAFTYESRARMETVQYTKDPVTGFESGFTFSNATIGTYNSTNNRANGTVAYTMNGNTVTSATIGGFMPARTDDNGVAITDQESWNVSYVRTPEADGVNKFELSGDITALKGGLPMGSVALQAGSYIRAVLDTEHIVNHGLKEVNLVLAIAGINSKVVGTLSLSNYSVDKSGISYRPTDLKFVGRLTNSGSEFFNGTWTGKITNYANFDISQPTSTTNFVKASSAFVGTFRIPNRPDLTLSLNASIPAFESSVFSGQYDDGSNTILVSSSNASPKVISISSADGVSMQLNGGVNTADVLKNGSKIATFDRTSWIINYNDGSFESLK